MLMKKIKRRMTKEQEFEIMKLVLDKFLWLGFGIMAFGLYQWFTSTISDGIYYMVFGIIVLILFVWILVKEYEFLK